MTNEFLRELWEEKTRRERPEKYISELERMRELVFGNEKLEKLFEKVIEASLRYCKTRDQLALVYIEGAEELGLNILKEFDQARRIAHNALVDSLNILSRACAKEGVSNRWREKLTSREAIGDWAIKLAVEYKNEKMGGNHGTL